VSAEPEAETHQQIQETIDTYYVEADGHQKPFLAVERLRIMDDIKVEQRISYDFGEEWDEPQTRHGIHDAVRDQVLEWVLADIDEAAPVVFADEYNEMPVYLDTLLSEYLSSDDRFPPELIRTMHGDTTELYGERVEELFPDGSEQLVVCEPKYASVVEGMGTRRGELDIAVFDVTTNNVTYIEVKSNGPDGASYATDQVDRFTAYAEAFDWTVDGKIALHDTQVDQTFLCSYDPD
jgi:hypothetical protein